MHPPPIRRSLDKMHVTLLKTRKDLPEEADVALQSVHGGAHGKVRPKGHQGNEES